MTDESRPDSPGTRSAGGEIIIDVGMDRVWRALTDARELERWFPLDARVEPGEGGTIWMSWRNEYAGEMRILVWDPPHHLRTAWAFHEGDAPGQVTDYRLEARGGSTLLRVVTSGFPLDAAWDGWVEGTDRGWAFELRSLKHYLERHADEPRHVVYLRRRVALPAAEAWGRLEASPDFAALLGAGDPFDRRPGGQYAAVLPDPADELFRISVEPGAPGSDLREIVLFLSSWGDRAPRVRSLETDWGRILDRTFPEGTPP